MGGAGRPDCTHDGVLLGAGIHRAKERFARRSLHADCLLHTLGPATCDLAMDLAARADRARHGSQVPIGDEWGNVGEHEETQIGFAMAKWLRRRLPKDKGHRRDLYQQVMKGLQAQLTQEARQTSSCCFPLHVGYGSGDATRLGR